MALTFLLLSLFTLFTFFFTYFFFYIIYLLPSLIIPLLFPFLSRVGMDFAKYGDVAFLFLPKLHPTHNAQPLLRPNDRLRRRGSSLSIKKEQVPLAKKIENRLSLGCRAIWFVLLSDRLIIPFFNFRGQCRGSNTMTMYPIHGKKSVGMTPCNPGCNSELLR